MTSHPRCTSRRDNLVGHAGNGIVHPHGRLDNAPRLVGECHLEQTVGRICGLRLHHHHSRLPTVPGLIRRHLAAMPASPPGSAGTVRSTGRTDGLGVGRVASD